MHSAFALSTLLYTTDDTIRAYYDDVRRVGAGDQQMRLMTAGGVALANLAKAEKWLYTRRDVESSFDRAAAGRGIAAAGPPEEFAACPHSYTGRELRSVLARTAVAGAAGAR